MIPSSEVVHVYAMHSLHENMILLTVKPQLGVVIDLII